MKKNILIIVHSRHSVALATFLFFIFIFSRSSAQPSINIDSLKRALNSEIPDSQRVNVLISLASAIPCSDTISKLKYAKTAELLSKKIQLPNHIIVTDLILGNIYYSCTSNYASALQYYLLANLSAGEINDHRNQVIAAEGAAVCYQKMGEHKQAIDFYRQELNLEPNSDQEMGILGNLGQEYNVIGDYNRAISAYYNSLKVLDKLLRTKKNHDLNDTVQMAGLLLNIGDVYLAMSQPDKALENYDSAYKIGLRIKNKKIQTLGLMSIGQTYKSKKNYEKSIELYQSALVECKDFNDKDKVEILNELGNAYMEKGDLSSAMDYTARALTLAQEKINNGELPTVYITLGKVYMQKSDYGNAISYLQQGLNISQKNGALNNEKEAWAALSSTYEKINQSAEAFDAYRHFISIRDSLYNIDRANEFTRQELDFSYKNKELADKLNYDKKIARQQVLMYSGFVALIPVLLLVFFIYRNYQIQKKYNELLSKEQKQHLAQIEAQDHVLTDIANIQSHEIRGPVATILGLLQLYNYSDPTDPINKEVMDGLNKVTIELDTVVKEVIIMENKLKRDQGKGII